MEVQINCLWRMDRLLRSTSLGTLTPLSSEKKLPDEEQTSGVGKSSKQILSPVPSQMLYDFSSQSVIFFRHLSPKASDILPATHLTLSYISNLKSANR